ALAASWKKFAVSRRGANLKPLPETPSSHEPSCARPAGFASAAVGSSASETNAPPIASDFPPGLTTFTCTFDRSGDSTWARAAGARRAARTGAARSGRSLLIVLSPLLEERQRAVEIGRASCRERVERAGEWEVEEERRTE